MNEDIKEILEHLSATQKINNGWTSFSVEECKGLYNYITNLQEENEFLKLNNPEMNIEHFRIVKENKRKIDNLRKENKHLKETIKEAKEKSIKLQEKYNYILDDLTFILARGIDYE